MAKNKASKKQELRQTRPKVEKAGLKEIGLTGLKTQQGIIREEFLRELQGTKGVKAYRQMSDNDPVIGGILKGIKNIIGQLEWEVEPGIPIGEEVETPTPEQNQAIEDAEFAEESLNDMNVSWRNTLSEITTMLEFGWSYLEVVLKRREDGRFGWKKWAIRAQESLVRWVFDDDGGIQGMVQRDPISGKLLEIPIDRSLLFRTVISKGNPEGRSVLRNAYVPYFRKNNIEQFEAIGIERNIAGFPIAWVPPEILQNNASSEFTQIKQELEDLLSRVKNDEQGFVMWPLEYDENGNKAWDFQFISVDTGNKFDATDKAIARYNLQIALSMLFDVILIGHEKVGSFAVGETKLELALMGVQSIADQIEEIVNKHAIPNLFLMNGERRDKYPKLKHSAVEHADLEKLGKYIESLSRAGMLLFPDQKLENMLREKGGMPFVSDEELQIREEAAQMTPTQAKETAREQFLETQNAEEEENGDS